MSRFLSVSNTGLATSSPTSIIKKAAKKAAKKSAKKAAKKSPGHHHPKKHAGPGHDDHKEIRRAYLHLARVSSLLSAMKGGKEHDDLQMLYSFCKKELDSERISLKAVAELARALEHLSFAVFTKTYSPSISTRDLTREQQHTFEEHFQHDFEKQKEHLEDAEEHLSHANATGKLAEIGLLELARHSLATAKEMKKQENWHLAHECLRATDAITKALDHPFRFE